MPLATTYTPAAPAAATGQGSAVSNYEDLSDTLTTLAPKLTPILALATKGKADSTFHEWTVDALEAPNTIGVREGQDITSFEDKRKKRARLGNYVSLLQRPYMMSTLQAAVKSVGGNSIATDQATALLELKRDIEALLASDNDRTVENGAGTPYGARGLGDWLDSAGPADVPVSYRTPAASILGAAPTEQTLNDQLGSIFTVTGDVSTLTLIAGVSLRKVIANITRTDNNASETVYHVNQDATSKKVTLSVMTFESDFGIINIVNGNPACMPAATRGYLLSGGKYGVNDLISIRAHALDNQGGGERGYVEWAGTLKMNHPQAHGKIAY